ncbi:PREDICTED: sterol O-acyltransferase 1-like [Amphimedon queenslandica]|uniref:O-acyltransferase n=1 Tax=Amphimedon queenslandica TaxID=400682 RepID=I1FX10_AMPQE|nr:PREDICTED: sterol O-acyltransferase 1-like [Amphimedon queenslandica]|eukprot:XP_019851229.1 PREDICTED: sterol O-acyltransferase 1-like [Amphimedon queenslandica]
MRRKEVNKGKGRGLVGVKQQDYSEDSDSSSSSPVRAPCRIFRSQESVTSSLISSDPNFQAIHDAFLIQLLLILLLALGKDSYSAGKLYLNMSLFTAGFGSMSDIATFIIIEICLHAWVLLIHPLLNVWRKTRTVGGCCGIIDVLTMILYVAYNSISFACTVYIIVNATLPHLLNLVIGVEQFRMFMKNYSFVRENAYKVLYPWSKDDKTGPAVWYEGQMSPKVGSFRQYIYFLFCPTLLYRDHYPRKNSIDWSFVLTSGIKFLLALWSSVFILKNIIFPPSLKQGDLVNTLLMCLVLAFVIKFIAHTAILNAYLNMMAELMGFADRQFFSEWWTCTTYSSYYRKWNLLVHDWIHSYVYLDLKKIFGKKLAVYCTLLVSSIVHEYLLSAGTGFVLPIVTVLFAGVGAFFYVLKPLSTRRASNLFFLSSMNIGVSIILFFLVTEYAARHYCTINDNTFKTLFQPQMFSCYRKFNSLDSIPLAGDSQYNVTDTQYV